MEVLILSFLYQDNYKSFTSGHEERLPNIVVTIVCLSSLVAEATQQTPLWFCLSAVCLFVPNCFKSVNETSTEARLGPHIFRWNKNSCTKFSVANTNNKNISLVKLSSLRRWIFLIIIVILFILSGGIIPVLQSMSMTFSLCGPLKLEYVYIGPSEVRALPLGVVSRT